MNLFFTANQDRVFVIFIVLGVVLGIVYDIFKVKRMIFGASFWILFVDDLLYSFVSCVLILLSIFAFNNGIVRWFEFSGSLVGFFVYRMTVSKIVLCLISYVITICKRLIRLLLRLVSVPIKCMLKPVKRLICYLKNRLVIINEKAKIVRFIKYI